MTDPFDFKKRLGAGYFGEVWLASDLNLNCDIALKCIPVDKVINSANLHQEAQVLKAAEHANIIKVQNTGFLSDGRLFIAMEYLPNGSLEDEAMGAFIKLSRAKRLMSDVLRGLEHAHGKGILHRDVKPANILIGNGYEGKLSDFGLAVPNATTLKVGNLREYQYLMHLAPEVTDHTLYTKQADVYACGITLYRLINGDNYLPQFSDFNDVKALSQAGKFPDRSKYREFVPRSLRIVVNRAMNPDPQMRYQSAIEFRHALESVPLYADWDEQTTSAGTVWKSCKNGVSIEVSRLQTGPNRFDVLTRKGSLLLRKVAHQSAGDLPRVDAERFCKKVLQEITVTP